MRTFFAAVAIAALAALSVPAHAAWVSPWANGNCEAGTTGYGVAASGWDVSGNPVGGVQSYIGFGNSAGYGASNGIQLFANYGGTVTVTSSPFHVFSTEDVGGYYRYYMGLRATPTASINLQQYNGASWVNTGFSVNPIAATEFAWTEWSTTLNPGQYRVQWTWTKAKPTSYPTPPQYLAPNQGWLQFDGVPPKTPEPASMVMLGMAATGYLASRRRRKGAKA